MREDLDAEARSVLDFWFGELEPKHWFAKDTDLDERISKRFRDLHGRAAHCELWAWRKSPHGRLAEIIVLDQFSRNIHRDNARAFACDPLSLALSQEAVAAGADTELTAPQRAFLYMPYMHSESPAIQAVAVRLYDQPGLEYNLRFAIDHKAIIDRFGRYPHRNHVLGRTSTAEELAFLKEPGSAF